MLLPRARYLVAIADHAISRAAAELHVSQLAPSQQIRQIEDTLRAPLLDRSGVLVPLEFALPERTVVLLQRKGLQDRRRESVRRARARDGLGRVSVMA
jgi:LysR family cyn operon transcriptional activator